MCMVNKLTLAPTNSQTIKTPITKSGNFKNPICLSTSMLFEHNTFAKIVWKTIQMKKLIGTLEFVQFGTTNILSRHCHFSP